LSKEEKDNDPGGKHRFEIRGDHRIAKSKSKAKPKAKSKSMKKPTRKEETGKQILARIMRELWANIERKERHKKSLTYHSHTKPR